MVGITTFLTARQLLGCSHAQAWGENPRPPLWQSETFQAHSLPRGPLELQNSFASRSQARQCHSNLLSICLKTRQKESIAKCVVGFPVAFSEVTESLSGGKLAFGTAWLPLPQVLDKCPIHFSCLCFSSWKGRKHLRKGKLPNIYWDSSSGR